jgi:hypothetical protein
MEITVQQVKILYVNGSYEYCWVETQYAEIGMQLTFTNDGHTKQDAAIVQVYPETITGIERNLGHCYRIKHPVTPDTNDNGLCCFCD